MLQQRGDGALREARIHGEGLIGRAEHFVDRHGERRRQVLTAEFGRRRDAEPAALDQLLEGVLEAGRGGDAAVRVARAAFFVTDPVERGEHFLGKLAGFAQHGFDQIGRSLGKSRQVAVAVEMEDVVQQEQRVVNGRLIGRHRSPPGVQRAPLTTR